MRVEGLLGELLVERLGLLLPLLRFLSQVGEREILIDNLDVFRKVHIRLPGKGNSNSRGARPVYSFR